MTEFPGHAVQAGQNLAVHRQRAADSGADIAAEGHTFEILQIQAFRVVPDDHVHVAVDEHRYAEAAQSFRHVHVVQSRNERGLQHYGACSVDDGREADGNRLQLVFAVEHFGKIAFEIVGELGHRIAAAQSLLRTDATGIDECTESVDQADAQVGASDVDAKHDRGLQRGGIDRAVGGGDDRLVVGDCGCRSCIDVVHGCSIAGEGLEESMWPYRDVATAEGDAEPFRIWMKGMKERERPCVK